MKIDVNGDIKPAIQNWQCCHENLRVGHLQATAGYLVTQKANNGFPYH